MNLTPNEEKQIRAALRILDRHLRTHELQFTSPNAVRDYLRLRLAPAKVEIFMALFLTAQHHLIEAVALFQGTLTQTSVYPREVMRAALDRNAAAVIFAHNHPSGIAMPSQADQFLTRNLREALLYIDVSVLDHFIVGNDQVVSFAEKGLL